MLVSWFLGFKHYWFIGFKVSWLSDFKVLLISWFQTFKASKIYQISMSCFLEDIDPISKIFKKSLDGSSGFPRALFSDFSKYWIFHILIFIRIISFENDLGFVVVLFLSILGPQKINNIGLGPQGHVKKFRSHENEGFEGSHITKSKSYKFKMEQNNTECFRVFVR